MATTAPFIPPHPARPNDYAAQWRGFFGERLKNSIYGWPEKAFEMRHFRRDIVGIRIHFAFDPDSVGRVLLDNKENYIRPGIAQRIMAPVIGNGLLSAEGEDWRKQRKIVAPTFAPGAVADMAATVADVAARQVAGWTPGSVRLDMAQEATRATSDIIAAALFSGDHRLNSPDAGHAIDALLASGGQARLMTLIGLERFDFSPTMRAGRKGRDVLRANLSALVNERGPSGGADDFFGGLIRALHAQFPPTEAKALAVDNAITFYVAGHETTANALAWTIYLLAAQPAVQERAREEALAALSGNPATLADRTPYLRQILDESMRLYPPAPRFDREAVGDDKLGDVDIKRGDLVSIWPWILHRHRLLWDAPDAFDPERFAPSAKAHHHRFQYIPFGAGPRVCVGARFAVVEALVILAHWLAARRFELPPGFRPDPVGGITLRPRGGMPLIVRPI
jgi:cytochrome P450